MFKGANREAEKKGKKIERRRKDCDWMCRSFRLVSQLGGCLAVKHEVVRENASQEKGSQNRAREDGRSDAEVCSVPSIT